MDSEFIVSGIWNTEPPILCDEKYNINWSKYNKMGHLWKLIIIFYIIYFYFTCLGLSGNEDEEAEDELSKHKSESVMNKSNSDQSESERSIFKECN